MCLSRHLQQSHFHTGCHFHEAGGLTSGEAPFGPVTCTALVRPSSVVSLINSTGSPSLKLLNPSVLMEVCKRGDSRMSRFQLTATVGSISLFQQ